jgi:starvation-inducible DNA-binding protein
LSFIRACLYHSPGALTPKNSRARNLHKLKTTPNGGSTLEIAWELRRVYFKCSEPEQRTPMEINIGIKEKDRKAIAKGLSHLLADSYTLYLKTHNFHWNVEGPMFNTLHLMFEAQYTELALAVDLIAERIRALGFPAPGTYKEFAAMTSIKEETGPLSAEEMIRSLVEGQEAVTRTARKIFPMVEKASDEPSADLLTQRMQLHEKTAWMLRSLLQK